jgi:hypothetical protein
MMGLFYIHKPSVQGLMVSPTVNYVDSKGATPNFHSNLLSKSDLPDRCLPAIEINTTSISTEVIRSMALLFDS